MTLSFLSYSWNLSSTPNCALAQVIKAGEEDGQNHFSRVRQPSVEDQIINM